MIGHSERNTHSRLTKPLQQTRAISRHKYYLRCTMKKDISTREDIELLMKVFYERLLADGSINYIFTEVARINLEEHLLVIADFWESILFERNVYHNNPMKIHLEMAGKTPLLKHHFDTWLSYFEAAVDEFFDGKVALKAKQRALSIATVMQVKILQQENGII